MSSPIGTPQREARCPSMEASSTTAADKRRSSSTKGRALVVDDVEDCAVSLALLLQLEGYETHVAQGGTEAVELARRLRPTIIFMDLGMPEVDGYEATRRIRQQPGGEQLVICALSAYGPGLFAGSVADDDFDYRLLKPAPFEEIAAVLSRAARPLENH